MRTDTTWHSIVGCCHVWFRDKLLCISTVILSWVSFLWSTIVSTWSLLIDCSNHRVVKMLVHSSFKAINRIFRELNLFLPEIRVVVRVTIERTYDSGDIIRSRLAPFKIWIILIVIYKNAAFVASLWSKGMVYETVRIRLSNYWVINLSD